MKNKEIIIDGIEVNECEYLNPLDNGVYECILGKKQMLKYRVCDCNHNCYFKQLKRAEQECEGLKEELKMNQKFVDDNHIESTEFCKKFERYKRALDEIEEIAQTGLKPICYKSNCSRCECYDGDNCNAGVINFLNYYFDDNGDLRNDEDLDESLRDLVDTERQKCNRAMPISKKILDIINKAKDGE